MNQVFFSYHGETEAEIFHPSTMRDFEFRRDDSLKSQPLTWHSVKKERWPNTKNSEAGGKKILR